jgi:hypothetical protein
MDRHTTSRHPNILYCPHTTSLERRQHAENGDSFHGSCNGDSRTFHRLPVCFCPPNLPRLWHRSQQTHFNQQINQQCDKKGNRNSIGRQQLTGEYGSNHYSNHRRFHNRILAITDTTPAVSPVLLIINPVLKKKDYFLMLARLTANSLVGFNFDGEMPYSC